jgi:hypothetical protein
MTDDSQKRGFGVVRNLVVAWATVKVQDSEVEGVLVREGVGIGCDTHISGKVCLELLMLTLPLPVRPSVQNVKKNMTTTHRPTSERQMVNLANVRKGNDKGADN